MAGRQRIGDRGSPAAAHNVADGRLVSCVISSLTCGMMAYVVIRTDAQRRRARNAGVLDAVLNGPGWALPARADRAGDRRRRGPLGDRADARGVAPDGDQMA